MEGIKQAQLDMEPVATLHETWLFEAPQDKHRVLQIVAIEKAQLPSTTHAVAYEFYRARASMPGTPKDHFHVWGNTISVTVCHTSKTVLFGPTGQIQMYPEGHGLGPALMANVINWLHCSGMRNYVIVPGSLSSGTVHTPDERIRRNRFYSAFGFTLSGSNADHESVIGDGVLSGHFSAPLVGSLMVPQRYIDRLKRCADVSSSMQNDRFDADQTATELRGIRAWAKGHTWAAVLKRITLFVMNSPIDRR